MTQSLWRPSGRKAAKDNPLDDLMEQIELLVREGQVSQLKGIQADLKELIMAIDNLIGKMASQKAYGYDLKASGISKALEEMRSRVERKRPSTGREAVRGMAAWIAEH